MKKRRAYLMYHAIGTKTTNLNNWYSDKVYTVTEEEFRRQMEYLSIYNANNEMGLNVNITFDDGHISNLITALPILQEFNMKATFFITTDLVGKENFMDWEQLRILVKAGMDIGSHAKSHKPLTSLSKSEAYHEISYSKEILEKNLEISVNKISCPGGFYNRRTIYLIKKSGFEEIYTSDVGVMNSSNKESLIPRISIKADYTLEVFKSIIEYNNYFIFKLIITDRAKKIVKSIIPNNIYRRLYLLKNR